MAHTNDRAIITHKVPDDVDGWRASQVGRSVIVTEPRTGREFCYRPPRQWGDAWNWNVTSDGSGIYFCQTKGAREAREST
jgi:hypothetical protein